MPTYRKDVHTGHKVPLVETDDISKRAITPSKLSPEVIEMIKGGGGGGGSVDFLSVPIHLQNGFVTAAQGEFSNADFEAMFGPVTSFEPTKHRFEVLLSKGSNTNILLIPASYNTETVIPGSTIHSLYAKNGDEVIQVSWLIDGNEYVNGQWAYSKSGIISTNDNQNLTTTQQRTAQRNIGIDLEDILTRIEALERKIDPQPEPKPAYTVVTVKPTQETIAGMVDPTAEKPAEAMTVDMTSLTKPTMCYLTYPQEWEVVVDDIVQIPYMIDSNGFEIGATFDAETPLLTTGGVLYRVLDIRLGKGVYKLNFKR